MAPFLLKQLLKMSEGCPQMATGFVIVTRSEHSRVTPLKFFYEEAGGANSGTVEAESDAGNRGDLRLARSALVRSVSLWEGSVASASRAASGGVGGTPAVRLPSGSLLTRVMAFSRKPVDRELDASPQPVFSEKDAGSTHTLGLFKTKTQTNPSTIRSWTETSITRHQNPSPRKLAR